MKSTTASWLRKSETIIKAGTNFSYGVYSGEDKYFTNDSTTSGAIGSSTHPEMNLKSGNPAAMMLCEIHSISHVSYMGITNHFLMEL